MSVKDCFNKAASKYDANCQLQIKTGEHLLNLIAPVETLIDLGCGTGIVTAKLKYKKLYALDVSDKLLDQAKIRLGKNGAIYLEMSFDDFLGLELDLAFANMSLQWSEDLQSTLNNIKANLKPGGILAFSIPLIGTFADFKMATMSFFSFEQIKQLLSDWEIIYSAAKEINYLFPSLMEALRSIKSVGANYCKTKGTKLISRDKSPYLLKYKIGYFVVRKR